MNLINFKKRGEKNLEENPGERDNTIDDKGGPAGVIYKVETGLRPFETHDPSGSVTWLPFSIPAFFSGTLPVRGISLIERYLSRHMSPTMSPVLL